MNYNNNNPARAFYAAIRIPIPRSFTMLLNIEHLNVYTTNRMAAVVGAHGTPDLTSGAGP
jgi:hypothetical protein